MRYCGLISPEIKVGAMIKDNQKKFNLLHVVIDALVIIVSYILAWGLMILRNKIFNPEWSILPARYYFSVLVVVVPAYLLLYAIFHLYTPKRVQAWRIEFANIVKANLLGLLIFTLVTFLFKNNPYLQVVSGRMVLYFFAININFSIYLIVFIVM